MKNNIIMAVAELEDGREHIHAKQHRPEKYDLSNPSDLKSLKQSEKLFVKDKVLCYSKDLTQIHSTKGSDRDTIVLVNKIRYEPYNANLHIPYRTFSVMFPKQSQEELS